MPNAAVRFLSGDRSSETLDALAAAIACWAAQRERRVKPLERFLGLETPRRTRTRQRGAVLREADQWPSLPVDTADFGYSRAAAGANPGRAVIHQYADRPETLDAARAVDVPPSARVARIAREGLAHDDDRRWLEQACTTYGRGLDDSFERACGLMPSQRKKRRNDALIAAARRLDAGRNLGRWTLAAELQREVRVFLRRRDRAGLSPVQGLIRAAKAAGARMDLSTQALYKILLQTFEDES